MNNYFIIAIYIIFNNIYCSNTNDYSNLYPPNVYISIHSLLLLTLIYSTECVLPNIHLPLIPFHWIFLNLLLAILTIYYPALLTIISILLYYQMNLSMDSSLLFLKILLIILRIFQVIDLYLNYLYFLNI